MTFTKKVFRIFTVSLLCLIGCILQAQSKPAINVDDSLRIVKQLQSADLLKISNPDSAIEILTLVISDLEKKSIPNLLIEAQWLMSWAYSILDKNGEALRYSILAINTANKNADSLNLPRLYNGLGDEYFKASDYNAAYKNFLIANDLALRYRDTLTSVMVTHNIGKVLREVGDFNKAMDNFVDALHTGILIGDKEAKTYGYFEMGNTFLAMSQEDSAYKYYNLTLLSESPNDETDYIQCEAAIQKGAILIKKNRFEEAEKVYEEALLNAKKLSITSQIVSVYSGMVGLDIVRKNYKEAEELLNSCMELMSEVRNKKIEATVYKQHYQLQRELGNYEEALNYYVYYDLLKDTIASKAERVRIEQMQMEEFLEEKDKQIDALKQLHSERSLNIAQQNTIRNVLIIFVSVMALFLFTLYRSASRRKKINRLLQERKEEQDKQLAELENLNKLKDKFFSIISHDLRSPIRSLQGIVTLVATGNMSKEESQTMMGNISTRLGHTTTLLDNLLKWTLVQMNDIKLNMQSISIHSLVEKNVGLVMETNAKDIEVVNRVKKDLFAMADENMVDLIIRNLLSNAIKFTENKGKVEIFATEENDKVIINIKDDGTGMDEQEVSTIFDSTSIFSKTGNEKGTGLGLKLSKEFVEKNGGKIWVESEKGIGSVFSFSLSKSGD